MGADGCRWVPMDGADEWCLWVSPVPTVPGVMAYGAFVRVGKWGFTYTYVAKLDFSGKDTRDIHATG